MLTWKDKKKKIDQTPKKAFRFFDFSNSNISRRFLRNSSPSFRDIFSGFYSRISFVVLLLEICFLKIFSIDWGFLKSYSFGGMPDQLSYVGLFLYPSTRRGLFLAKVDLAWQATNLLCTSSGSSKEFLPLSFCTFLNILFELSKDISFAFVGQINSDFLPSFWFSKISVYSSSECSLLTLILSKNRGGGLLASACFLGGDCEIDLESPGCFAGLALPNFASYSSLYCSICSLTPLFLLSARISAALLRFYSFSNSLFLAYTLRMFLRKPKSSSNGIAL